MHLGVTYFELLAPSLQISVFDCVEHTRKFGRGKDEVGSESNEKKGVLAENYFSWTLRLQIRAL